MMHEIYIAVAVSFIPTIIFWVQYTRSQEGGSK